MDASVLYKTSITLPVETKIPLVNVVSITLPVAFSVRDYHEFQAHRDLLKRLHPSFRVAEVATGRHISGGGTCFWGIVHFQDQSVGEAELHDALQTAGFDFEHNGASAKVEV